MEWYKNYNFREFRNKYNLSNNDIAKDLNVAYTTACQITANDYTTYNVIKKVYDYVQEKENTTSDEIFEDLKETAPIVLTNNAKIEIVKRDDEMLKKLLISRLTDEEKELIKLFGGTIE